MCLVTSQHLYDLDLDHGLVAVKVAELAFGYRPCQVDLVQLGTQSVHFRTKVTPGDKVTWEDQTGSHRKVRQGHIGRSDTGPSTPPLATSPLPLPLPYGLTFQCPLTLNLCDFSTASEGSPDNTKKTTMLV